MIFSFLSLGVLSGPDTKNPFSKEDMSKAGNMKTAFSEKIPLEKVKDIKVRIYLDVAIFSALTDPCRKSLKELRSTIFLLLP